MFLRFIWHLRQSTGKEGREGGRKEGEEEGREEGMWGMAFQFPQVPFENVYSHWNLFWI